MKRRAPDGGYVAALQRLSQAQPPCRDGMRVPGEGENE
jgi:hypothetical protein